MATSFASGSEMRQRLITQVDPESDAAKNPYSKIADKVYLARKKKPDSFTVRICEGALVLATMSFALYAFFYFDNVHFHIVHTYAHLGYATAQHQVGQRFLHGKGVTQDKEKAMDWFHKASENGHAHAKYNLAVGHMKGIKTKLQPGDAQELIRHAAANGVPEAQRVLNDVCSRGHCDT